MGRHKCNTISVASISLSIADIIYAIYLIQTGGQPSTRLRKVTLPIVSGQCPEYTAAEYDENIMICAGSGESFSNNSHLIRHTFHFPISPMCI